MTNMSEQTPLARLRKLAEAIDAIASRPAAQSTNVQRVVDAIASEDMTEAEIDNGGSRDSISRDCFIETTCLLDGRARRRKSQAIVEGARKPAEDLVAIRAAWQVAIDRNIVLEREIEVLRAELTKQKERNSPQ